jgi:hypothetical protein
VKKIYLYIISLIRIAIKYDPHYLTRYPVGSFKFHFASLLSIYRSDELINARVAWWTYPAMEYLEKSFKNKRNLTIFEYGPGASTIWLSKYAQELYFVEYDEEFFNFMKTKCEGSSVIKGELIAPVHDIEPKVRSGKKGYEDVNFEDYVDSIGNLGKKFDVIVIDGRARCACLKVAIEYLNTGGMIIFDNSNRKRYSECLESYKTNSRVFRGWAPSLPYKDETTIIEL